MMMRSRCIFLLALLVLLAGGTALAQEDLPEVAYFQSRGFNVPKLLGWQEQSSEEIAQFYQEAAAATIRTAIVSGDDVIAAVEVDLARLLGEEVSEPLYEGKVNLADGTWMVLVYDIDAETTASVMARQDEGQVIIISFSESDPAARTVLLPVARGDESLEDAAPEIAFALASFTEVALEELGAPDKVELASGEWLRFSGEAAMAMGMVFGNDSYVAVQTGQLGDLALLADAWNRTLLGFFITPDNSVYLALGLASVVVILGTLILSFVWRSRNLWRDLALIEELAREDE